MSGFPTQELTVRERRFVRSALWKATAPSGVASLCLLLGSSAAFGAVLLGFDSRSMFGVFVIALVAIGFLASGGMLMYQERRRRIPDALVAINRCGACGHDLRGSRKIESRGVDIRSCTECGTHWTNLDRRFSIDQVYGSD